MVLSILLFRKPNNMKKLKKLLNKVLPESYHHNKRQKIKRAVKLYVIEEKLKMLEDLQSRCYDNDYEMYTDEMLKLIEEYKKVKKHDYEN